MRKYTGFFVVFLIGLVSIFDLLHPGFAVTHDGQDHIARIANFYINISQGIFIPRWAPNLNWGYGHPILEFLYPLPSYGASLLHFLTFSLVDATKLVFMISMVASGIAMYALVRYLWGEMPGTIAGVVYMITPYRFVDLYVRGDIGEHVAFVFIPLVFLGLLMVEKKQAVWRILFVAISLSCLILSHNAFALMFLPLILLFTVFLLWQKKWDKKLAAACFLALICGFALSAFFWFPALLEGQYTLRNIVTKGEYASRFVSVSQLVYGPWSYGQSGQFSVQLGIMNWVFLVSSIFLLWKKNPARILIAGLLVYTFLAILLMLSISNVIWQHFLLLQNFQFPWRFLAIPAFTSSIGGGYLIFALKESYKKIIVFFACMLVLLCNKDYMHAKAYLQRPDSFFTGIYASTTDTGESTPIWSVRFMQYVPAAPLQVISGSAVINQTKRLATQHEYRVISHGQTRLLENTLYFPGWKIFVDKNPVTVQFQDPQYRGLMTFFVPSGVHHVAVSYSESKFRLTGDILSVLGLLGAVFLLIHERQFHR